MEPLKRSLETISNIDKTAGRFVARAVAFLTREDQFPYYDAVIHDYKDDLKNYPVDTPDEVINNCILKLCRALVHSKDIKDVKEGIRKLQVGYYREKDYSSSLSYLSHCLEIAPHFNQALTLKKKFGSVLSFLIGGDYQYYRDMILDCERDIDEAGDDTPDEVKNENIIKLSWALVHTRQSKDVERGIALLEALIEKGGLSQFHIRDIFYIRSFGHYIRRDFIKSWNDVCQCLEVAPDFWQGQYLSKTVSTRLYNDEFLGDFIFCTACYTGGILVLNIIKARSQRKA
ncbi:hypothetical protein MKW94_013282 [Papaver nudicaule]|uniref:Uncharacterized protein n=1 Tax=Papaver nudicaule TaxID=74823 RepID=A0AA42B3L3_PAPNU|nr:hypothetical protein [Papaver nudicaule]